jgi:SAM-dependent methyltransferase
MDSQCKKSFAESLEEQFAEDSEKLANVHLEAAINAQLYDITFDDDENADPDKAETSHQTESSPAEIPNCYSPYVPTCAKRINGFIDFVQLSHDDVLLDLGCGDGRVCLVAAQTMLPSSSHGPRTFRAIGIDVSPDCIAMAEQIYAQTRRTLVVDDASNGPSVAFYQADVTVATSALLSGTGSNPKLSHELRSATVVYLYTYPTLLVRLVPLLARLFALGRLRAVVTLTYHLPAALPSSDEWTAAVDRVDTEHDLCLYKNIVYKAAPRLDSIE